MRQLWDRITNETAFVGSLVIIAIDGLWMFDVIALTEEQFGWINAALVAVFGGAVRQSVYSKRSVAGIETNYEGRVAELEGELLGP